MTPFNLTPEQILELDADAARLAHSQLLDALLAPGTAGALGGAAYARITREVLPGLAARLALEDSGGPIAETPTPAELEVLHRGLGNVEFADRLAAAQADYRAEADATARGLAAWEAQQARDSDAQRARYGLASQADLDALRAAGEQLPEGPARTAVMARVQQGQFDLQQAQRGAEE
jgi:hypothetical protein